MTSDKCRKSSRRASAVLSIKKTAEVVWGLEVMSGVVHGEPGVSPYSQCRKFSSVLHKSEGTHGLNEILPSYFPLPSSFSEHQQFLNLVFGRTDRYVLLYRHTMGPLGLQCRLLIIELSSVITYWYRAG
jgi:hypothetical protein